MQIGYFNQNIPCSSGVTRFIAVSVKTFVLCLGASFGLMLSLDNTHDMWLQQAEQCGLVDLNAVWWRVPLYLLCSASVLGQYRFPVRHYWRGLIVQLAAYEVQYETQKCVLTTNRKHTCVASMLCTFLGCAR